MAKEIYIDNEGNEIPINSAPTQAEDISYDNSESGLSATDVQGAIDEVNALLGNVGKIESLFISQAITATATAYYTYNNRKFSDYDLLIFKFGASAHDTRQTAVVVSAEWATSKQINMGALHGATATTPSSYSYSSVNFVYTSDTQFTASVSGSGILNVITILGIKLKA